MAFFGQDDSLGSDHFTKEFSVYKIFFVAKTPSPMYKKVKQTLWFQLERSLHHCFKEFSGKKVEKVVLITNCDMAEKIAVK